MDCVSVCVVGGISGGFDLTLFEYTYTHMHGTTERLSFAAGDERELEFYHPK